MYSSTYYDNILFIIPRKELGQKITPHIKKNIQPISNRQKKEVKWLFMNKTKEFIWFPSSLELWNFWGILQMLYKLN